MMCSPQIHVQGGSKAWRLVLGSGLVWHSLLTWPSGCCFHRGRDPSLHLSHLIPWQDSLRTSTGPTLVVLGSSTVGFPVDQLTVQIVVSVVICQWVGPHHQMRQMAWGLTVIHRNSVWETIVMSLDPFGPLSFLSPLVLRW